MESEITMVNKEIALKTQELQNLQKKADNLIKAQKAEVLGSKSKGMSKSLYLLGFEFESSSTRTPQYLEFHRVFKREFCELLKPHTTRIEISKPNHFDITGFFELTDKRIFYISLGDLRWNKDSIKIREAKDFGDYTGSSNNAINLDENFVQNLFRFLDRHKLFYGESAK